MYSVAHTLIDEKKLKGLFNKNNVATIKTTNDFSKDLITEPCRISARGRCNVFFSLLARSFLGIVKTFS